MQSCRPAAGEGIPFKWWLLGRFPSKDAGRPRSGNTQEEAGGDEEGKKGALKSREKKMSDGGGER